MRHRLFREQQLNCNIDTAWSFFSSADHLSEITPEDMNLTMLSQSGDGRIYEGMIIDYHISPLFGIRMRWQTEITRIVFRKSFTDLQKKGPYKLWNHHHEFIENEQGILMKDTVDYELPLSFLGEMAHRLLVEKKLEHLFDYRYKILEEKFNGKFQK
ncbi:SRPBCC family protein [Chryseobacterium gossypii]|uniref:SRPBCC family protein n=1 Tax=Chryseobacterium gossypii TaxID=3231602 RepID=UPI00352401E9